ncbi:uncharacterized protein LY89DRAFT_740878 [Mollisia scopiformis]|uniref:Uncharacterized protein n=1 Tax=Mollisia scopiformis TaxID=149040 RepID=A0A132BBL1_MOLSC|nr:uncharacterized protein LY89DRAFT_740878 [Mollisia scopiformis]KUJ09810.1 hypothetical protein LY89DRAFT_740878 [Mollisia scopiformis]
MSAYPYSSGYVPYNYTAPCNYTYTGYLATVQQYCGPYLDGLQTCTSDTVTPFMRLEAASQVSDCMYWINWALHQPNFTYDATNATWNSPAVPKTNTSATCNYPTFLPIAETACAWDFSQWNSIQSNTSCDYNVAEADWGPGRCVSEATVQYVRCTIQEPTANVASCIEANAQKADWLPQLEEYGGAASCGYPKNVVLIILGLGLLRGICEAFIHPWIKYHVKNAWRKYRKKDPDPTLFWDAARRAPRFFNLKAMMVVHAVGRELLRCYLAAVYMRKDNSNLLAPTFFRSFVLNAVLPRFAPFTGLFGLRQPWTQAGFADLFVDGVFSFVAGSFVGFGSYGDVPNQNPPNPATPQHALKIMEIGALMTVAPTYLFFVFLFLFSLRKGCIQGIFTVFISLIMVGILLLLLPIFALWEFYAAIRHQVRPFQNVRALQPISIDYKSFRGVYYFMIFFSWVINIGNWLFWASYLKLGGDLWCPNNVDSVVKIWVLIPFAVDVFFALFAIVTTDTIEDEDKNERTVIYVLSQPPAGMPMGESKVRDFSDRPVY